MRRFPFQLAYQSVQYALCRSSHLIKINVNRFGAKKTTLVVIKQIFKGQNLECKSVDAGGHHTFQEQNLHILKTISDCSPS